MPSAEEDALPNILSQKGSRMRLLEHTIAKRVSNLTYLKKVFAGEAQPGGGAHGDPMWMNLVRVTRHDLDTHFQGSESVGKTRLYNWFVLGISLAGQLSVQNGRQFLSVVLSLLGEWEYHASSGVGRMLRDFKTQTRRRKSLPDTGDGLRPQQASQGGAGEGSIDPSQAALHHPSGGGAVATPGHSPHSAAGGAVAGVGSGAATLAKATVYDYLNLPPVPTALCYVETVLCLCDVLMFVYRKFLDNDCTSDGLSKVIAIDKKLKHHFFGMLSREVEIVAEGVVRRAQKKLASLFGDFTDPPDQRGAGKKGARSGAALPGGGGGGAGVVAVPPALAFSAAQPQSTFAVGSGVHDAYVSGSDDDEAYGHRVTELPRPVEGSPTASPI